MALPALLRLALWFCPLEFRRANEEDIARNVLSDGRSITEEFIDIAFTGIRLRVELLVFDSVFAVRTLVRSKLFTASAILAIALAVGANTAVAAAIEAVVLNPLPFVHSEQLVFVNEDRDKDVTFSYADGETVRRASTTLSEFAVANGERRTLTGLRQPRSLATLNVSPAYFRVFGVTPALGTFFTDNTRPGSVVISYQLWRSAFQRDPTVLGRPLVLDGRRYSIVGVAPASFSDVRFFGIVQDDCWLPIDSRSVAAAPSEHNYMGVGRLRNGVSIDAAQADAGRIVAVLQARRAGNTRGTFHPGVKPMLETVVGPTARILWLLYGAVALVLIIACVDVANLTIVRTLGRQREMSLRAALGATRSRLIAQLSVEAALISVVGAAVGLGFAWLILNAFGAFGAEYLPRWASVSIDGNVLRYVAVLIVAITACIGVLPALVQRRNVAATLKATAGAGDTKASGSLRAGLVIGEVALAFAIVIAAGLLLRSFSALISEPLGFDASHTYIVQQTGSEATPDRSVELRRAREIARRIQAIPGVTDVAAAGIVPFSGRTGGTFNLPGHPGVNENALIDTIDPRFFGVLRMRPVLGRFFDRRDSASAPRVAVVSETFARRAFGTVNIIGRRVSLGQSSSLATSTIVGVAADVRWSFHDIPPPVVYWPMTQGTSGFSQFVVKTSGDSGRLSSDVAAAFADADARLPAPVVMSYQSVFERDLLAARANAMLFAALAAIGLLLALIGIYAVSSHAAEQRTHEFGIRRAVGAPARHVLARVLIGSLRSAVAGVAIGVVIAAALAPQLSTALHATSPLDAPTFGAAASVLIACAVAAALVPAVRAASMQPAKALRRE